VEEITLCVTRADLPDPAPNGIKLINCRAVCACPVRDHGTRQWQPDLRHYFRFSTLAIRRESLA
jgi:hypothetical protein